MAALVGEPVRARMLSALMSGMALTATELALEGGVAPSTASEHLARLTAAQILSVERRGRHRYFRLFDSEVAEVLEAIMGVSANRGPRRRIGPAEPDLRGARVCYDHLAGRRGVWLLDQLGRRRLLPGGETGAQSAEAGSFFARLGIDLPALTRSRRPLYRLCLDWSERRHHLGGALGTAILDRFFVLGWARRKPGSRAIDFTPLGERSLRELFGSA